MKLIPIDEAAAMLGVSTEKLLEMRSRNEIFGYRDGATWKFKDSELDRVAGQLGVSMSEAGAEQMSGVDLDLASDTGSDANILSEIDSDLDEMVSVEDSGLLKSEEGSGPKLDLSNDDALELGPADSGLILEGSDIELDTDSGVSLDAGSEVSLVDEGSGIDLDLGDDSEIKLDDSGAGTNVGLAAGTSDVELSLGDSDISLEAGDSAAELKLDSGSDLTLEGSDIQLEAGSDVTLEGSDIQLEGGSDLELELDSGSEISLEGSDAELVLEDTAGAGSGTNVGASSDVIDMDAETGGSGFDFDLSDVDLSEGSDVGKGAAAAGLAAAGAAAAAVGLTGKGDAAAESDILDLDGGSDLGLEAASDLDLSMSDSSIELDLDSDASSSSLNLNESGINLSSPSDSGISLEGAPPELTAGSDVDALELGEADVIDLGDEAVDLEDATVMADNDFLLEPVEGDLDDIDSGSQIIALDTEEIAPDANTLLDEGAFVETTNEMDPGLQSLPDEGIGEVAPLGAAAGAGAALAPEIPYSVWNIVGLSLCTLMMALAGMMMSDLVMNMWSWDGTYSLNSKLMDSVLGIFGM